MVRLIPRYELEKLAKQPKRSPDKWSGKDYALAGLTTALAGGGLYLGLRGQGKQLLNAARRRKDAFDSEINKYTAETHRIRREADDIRRQGDARRREADAAFRRMQDSIFPSEGRTSMRDIGEALRDAREHVQRASAGPKPASPRKAVFDMGQRPNGSWAPKTKESAAPWSILGAALVARRQG